MFGLRETAAKTLRRPLVSGALILAAGHLVAAPAAAAAPGQLDRTFGTDGASTLLYQPFASFHRAHAVTAAGLPLEAVAVDAGSNETRIAMARLTRRGALDTSFGSGGSALSSFALAPPLGRSTVNRIALQPDGRILVAGGHATSTGHDAFAAVARFTAGGARDSGFGSGGVIRPALGPDGALATGVAVQPDGKVVVAGQSGSTSAAPAWFVARFDAAGEPDAGFGAGGLATIGVPGPHQANWLALLPDGGIAVTGGVLTGGQARAMVARLTPAGVLDAGFDGDGIALFDFGAAGEPSVALGSAPQPDGSLVIGGYVQRPSASSPVNAVLARVGSDGRLDPGFGDGGLAVVDDLHSSVIFDLAADAAGRIVAAGAAAERQGAPGDTALFRFRPDGTPDPLFGVAGRSIASFDSGRDHATAVVLDRGAVIVSGLRFLPNQTRVFVARFGPPVAACDPAEGAVPAAEPCARADGVELP